MTSPPTLVLPRGGGRGEKRGRGFVSLVGAGPGDPKLLTLRGKEALEACDVVIYDHLAPPKILSHAPQAKRIYVGKRGGDPDSTPQKSIESLLVKLARRGKRIVRLKGGDPFVFGRGGEEILMLACRGIPFEIVPGVTAGVGAPAYAGIPVTHRGLASEVTFLTAHEDPLKKSSDVNWKAIAGLKGTLVLYMGVKTLPQVVRILLRYGKNPSTPVSVIRWGTTAEQQVVTGSLRTIARAVERAKLAAPALTVIGGVNRLRNKMSWFEEKPLFGKTVLVTRSRKQASKLSEMLEAEGARVLELPTIELLAAADNSSLNSAILRLSRYDWLVFTSENGVEAFFDRLRELKRDARILSGIKIAAIGPGTRAKLNSYLIEPDLVPRAYPVRNNISNGAYSTEGLLAAFRKISVKGKKFLLLRADIAPDLLNRELRKRGAVVTEIPIYRTVKPKGLSQNVSKTLGAERIDYITFTSSSTARNFFEAAPHLASPIQKAWGRDDRKNSSPTQYQWGRLGGGKVTEQRPKIISIGPVTSETIRECGAAVAREARVSTIPGLVEAVLEEEANGISYS